MAITNKELYPLQEFCFITKLAGFEYTKHLSGNFESNGIPLIQGKNIKNGELNLDGVKFINKELSNQLSRSQIRQNTIMFSYVGTVGDIYYHTSEEVLHLGSNVAKIVPDEKKIVPKFLYYSLKSPTFQRELFSKTKGSVQSNINMKDLRSLKIWIPPRDSQRQIIDVLSPIDDKIDLNNKINKNLEELAQTLYKHWFVDFEFPNEEGKPYKSSGGEMVESEIGIIPKEWNVTHLDDLFDFERGIEPGSKNYTETKTEGQIPFIRVGDLESTPKIYVDTSLVKDKTCKPDDVMISFDGAIGRVGIGLSGAYSTGIRKVTSKNNDIGFSFIYSLVKSQNIQDQILTYANGTTILHAGSSIKHLVMPFDLGAVLKLEEILQPLMKKILNNFDENRNLEALRDTLLPKLMSGEIEV
jgi:type I restriction enzyme S subunit